LSRIPLVDSAPWKQTNHELIPTLVLHSKDLPSLEQLSRFLLALKYFELDELTSGQAAGRNATPDLRHEH
jgi:hypothetical protein